MSVNVNSSNGIAEQDLAQQHHQLGYQEATVQDTLSSHPTLEKQDCHRITERTPVNTNVIPMPCL